MQLSDVVEFVQNGRETEPKARKEGHAIVWIDGDYSRVLLRKPGFYVLNARAALLPDVGFRRWTEDIAIADDVLGASRGGTASTQLIARCDVSLRPADNEEARRTFVQWLLDRDRMPLAGALRKEAQSVLIAQRDAHSGDLAKVLLDPGAQASVRQALKERLEARGLQVQRVAVEMVHRAEAERHDFADQDVGIIVRLRNGLNPIQVHWIARLVAATSPAGRAARAAYRGTFAGKIAIDYPDGIPGQQQPAEAWLVTLIGDALARIDLATFIEGDEWKAGVREEINGRLERGIGFIIDELEAKPTTMVGAAHPISFRQLYEITGTPGRAVWMEHRMTYRCVDEAAWLAAGKPDPKQRLIELTHNAVVRQLQPMKYGQVVVLLHQDSKGARTLAETTQKELSVPARHFGHEVESVVCILAVPEADYLRGRPVSIDAATYHLKGAGEEVRLSAELEVRVGDDDESLNKFADALADQAARATGEISISEDAVFLPEARLEQKIVGLVERALRRVLQNTPAKLYYASEFASGYDDAADETAGEWISLPPHETLEARMQAEVQNELSSLGLTVQRIEAQASSEDRIIQRMRELRRRPVPIDLPVEFEGRASTLAGRARVRDFSRVHWVAFYQNAMRYETVEEHLRHINGHFQAAIGMLKSTFQQGEAGVQAMIAQGKLQSFVQESVETEVGIIIEVAMLYLDVPSDFDPDWYKLRIERWKVQLLKLEDTMFEKRTTDAFEVMDGGQEQIEDLEEKIRKANLELRNGRSQSRHIPLIAGPGSSNPKPSEGDE